MFSGSPQKNLQDKLVCLWITWLVLPERAYLRTHVSLFKKFLSNQNFTRCLDAGTTMSVGILAVDHMLMSLLRNLAASNLCWLPFYPALLFEPFPRVIYCKEEGRAKMDPNPNFLPLMSWKVIFSWEPFVENIYS